MSIKAAAGPAIEAGLFANGVMFKYEKSLYLEKIQELEAHNAKLNQHLENLIALKAQMPGFWSDEKGEKAARALDKAIERVQSASKRIEDLNKIYQEAVNEFENLDKDANALLDVAIEALDGLDD